MSPSSPSPVPPREVSSDHMNERANAAHEHSVRSRVATSTPLPKEQSKVSSDWVDDTDEEQPRRRRRSKHHDAEPTKPDRQVRPKHQANAQIDVGRFLPKLSRILEATDPNVRQRSSVHGAKHSRHIDDKARFGRYRDNTDSTHRHPTRRTRPVQRRSEPIPGINPSLISVLSSLTGVSERSSESTSTITQQSYDRKRGIHSRTVPHKPKKFSITEESAPVKMSRMRSPNVFDYMEDVTSNEEHDGHSVVSPASSASSQSHYQGSDAGSSEGPGTPSSRSTMPSPTMTRNASVSVAELRRKYDPDYASSTSTNTSTHNLNTSVRGLRNQGSFRDATERENNRKEAASPSIISSRSDFNGSHRQDSHGSLRTLDGEQRLLQQEEAMRQHMAYSQHPYSYDFAQPAETSCPQHSPAPEQPISLQHQSLQHYIHQPVPTRPSPPKVVRSSPPPAVVPHHASLAMPPHAPDAPDYTKTTLAGYELIAAQFSPAPDPDHSEERTSTTVQPHLTPLYRKFSHLHHRILLQIQDELSEMEAQLRVYDEIAAQTYTTPPSSPPTTSSLSSTNPASSPDQTQTQTHHPASRRAETHPQSHPIFAHRTRLLGNIFLKQQQYHTALRDLNSLARDSRPAEDDEVEMYRAFLQERKPVWEGETKFLDQKEDLIVPLGGENEGNGKTQSKKAATSIITPRGRSKSTESDVLWEQTLFFAALLVLPFVLTAILPDLASRAAAIALLGIGAGLVVWGARVRART